MSDADTEETPPAEDGGDGGPSPVFVGVSPTPMAGPSGPTKGDEFAAMLTVAAAGARSAVISRSWADVEGGGLADVAPQIDFYSQHKTHVLFNLAVASRNQDGRPADAAALPWDDPSLGARIDAAVESVLKVAGPGIDILTIGRELDVFLAANPDQADAIAKLALRACEAARMSPSAPKGLRVAIAASFEGIASRPDVVKAIVDASDVIALSYIPGQDGALDAPPTEVASHLDQMIAIASAADKPIVLQAVGYPSEPFMLSSSAKQDLFFEAFFAALLPRRAAFAWVNIQELHDLWPPACAAYAEGQGEAPDSGTASFACSLGLFTSAGAEKPAWARVLEGAATFASP